MDWLRAILETSPLDGAVPDDCRRLPGRRSQPEGFALGSGAVLFVGLACGAFAPKSAPPAMLGTLGPAALPLLRRHPVRRTNGTAASPAPRG